MREVRAVDAPGVRDADGELVSRNEIGNLSDDDRSLLSSALRIAAARYAEDAKVSREAGHPRLGEQFDRQEAQAILLADEIDDADAVRVIS